MTKIGEISLFLAMIIVSATDSSHGQKRSLFIPDRRSLFCWSPWQIDVIQQMLEQVFWPCSKEPFRWCSPLVVLNEEVVNGGESSQLAVTDAMQSVMTQR